MVSDYWLYPESDLDEILEISSEHLRKMANSSVAILGGSGFIGSWIASALLRANALLSLNIKISIYSRHIEKTKSKFGLLPANSISFKFADFAVSQFPEIEKYDFYINAATPSVSTTGSEDPDNVYGSTVNSSKFILNSSDSLGGRPTVLNLSSGAIYGKSIKEEPENPFNLIEDKSVYAEAKRDGEVLLKRGFEKGLIKYSSPRLFAFMGPGLATDAHFAVGNFLRDALAGKEIVLQGSPFTERSYLYPTDLVSVLFELLLNPQPEEIDIGSSLVMSMQEIADTISRLTTGVKVTNLENSSLISSYYPSANKGRKIMPAFQRVSFEEGVSRWATWIAHENTN
jgi:dTDP-glucose 4,6-dehydratase